MLSIKRNILTIKQNKSEVGRTKDLSASRYLYLLCFCIVSYCTAVTVCQPNCS